MPICRECGRIIVSLGIPNEYHSSMSPREVLEKAFVELLRKTQDEVFRLHNDGRDANDLFDGSF